MTAVLAQTVRSAYPAYLRCLDEADENGAIDLALALLDGGVPPDAVLLSLSLPLRRGSASGGSATSGASRGSTPRRTSASGWSRRSA